jgi:hypothetical protein
MAVVTGQTNNAAENAVFGHNDATSAPSGGGVQGAGVFGLSVSPGAAGVFGANNSAKGVGVQGNGPERGVSGFSDGGAGAVGQSNKASGVLATSANGQGLTALSDNDVGVFAQGGSFAGVFYGAVVVNKGPNPKDPNKHPPTTNGSIVINDGSLFVNKGDVILGSADCAEDFGVSNAAQVEPGTVMVLDEEGDLCESYTAYDKRVAGVISGAGSYKPGLVLDRRPGEDRRVPIALLGKVYCKVDAQYGQVAIGDLLTTSPTPGHAMKATDTVKAFGATIGKALRPLEAGQALVPILVALQ